LTGLPGEPTPTFTLVFAGDVMLGRGVAQALDGDWVSAFAAVRPWLATADCAFANLESPLTTAPQVSEGYDLRAPPAAVAALQSAGFCRQGAILEVTLRGGRIFTVKILPTVVESGRTLPAGPQDAAAIYKRLCPTNQPTNQPANQPTNQPANQPTNQPANQLTN